MKRKWAWLALGGSLLLMGSSSGFSGGAVSPAAASTLTKEAAKHASVQMPSQAAAASPSGQAAAVSKLDEVNGITLADDRKAVVAKLGVPAEIRQDPLFPDQETYHYAGLDVTFSGAYVQDVTVPQGAGSVALDGVRVDITPASLREALGNPDYVAEDGLVYQRGSNLLKVYLDKEKERIDVIRYYSLSNT